NFGLAEFKTEWVPPVDADYELSDDLVRELAELKPQTAAGFRASFVYRIDGRSLRGTIYPPRIVLYRVRGASYRNEGHGHRLALDGEVRDLGSAIYHDDRKPLSRSLASQQRYAEMEAKPPPGRRPRVSIVVGTASPNGMACADPRISLCFNCKALCPRRMARLVLFASTACMGDFDRA